MPPAPGIAAPSSAHTSPSTSASSAPTIHPNTACGPPSAAIISGIVTNGPIPHIWVMLIATAVRRPIPCSKPRAASGAGPSRSNRPSRCADGASRRESMTPRVPVCPWN